MKKLLIVVLCLLMFPFVFGVLTDDIENYYTLDQITGTTAIDSLNNNNGTANNARVFTSEIAGIINTGADFTQGNDYIQVNNVLASSGTISLWVRPSTVTGNQFFFGHRTSNAIANRLYIYQAGANAVFNVGSEDFTVTGAYSINTWYHVVLSYNSATGAGQAYINGINVGNITGTAFTPTTFWALGALRYTDLSFTGDYLNGRIDEVGVWNRVLTQQEVLQLYNNGLGIQYPFIVDSGLFNLTASNVYTNDPIVNFTAGFTFNSITINGTSLDGSIIFPRNTFIDESEFTSNTVGENTYYNYTFDSNYVLYGLIANISTGNHSLIDTCYIQSTIQIRVFVPTVGAERPLFCYDYDLDDWVELNPGNIIPFTFDGITVGDDIPNTVTITINSDGYLEQEYVNYDLAINLDAKLRDILGNVNITSFTYNVTEGFLNSSQLNIIGICQDTTEALPLNISLNYNITHNGNVVYNNNVSTNTTVNFNTTLVDGQNTLVFRCSDALFNDRADVRTEIFEAYVRIVILWNEITNVGFDQNNITTARVFFGDNPIFFDFKASNTNNVTVTAIDEGKLRFELVYDDDNIIRYIDTGMVNNTLIKVCANTDGVQHYEQLVIASTQKAIKMQNTYTKCYVLADTTRFAYQDTLSVRAFTIDSLYYLITELDGVEVILASVDGTQQSEINLDNLEFQRSAVTINILQDYISFEKTNTDEITIIYENAKNDNINARLVITRLDTNQQVIDVTDFADPNNINIIFDYSTLTGVNESTLFKVEITGNRAGGEFSVSRYFNTLGQVGFVAKGFAIILSILLIMFGLTFTITRYTFSFIGIGFTLGAIAVLALAIKDWYVLFLMSIETILLIYIILMLMTKYYPTVS